MRIEPWFRFALYGAFAALFATGALWLVADRLKDSADGETWQMVAADLLMVHGGVTMITLMMLGALVPLHARRGWRAGRNRLTGAAMATFNAILITTAFGLYYFGSDSLRPWASALHTDLGLLLPVLLVVHVMVGRRSSAVRTTGGILPTRPRSD